MDIISTQRNMNKKTTIETIPIYVMINTLMSFLTLILIGHIRDAFGKIFHPKKYRHMRNHNGFPPLYTCFESFYTRRLYTRIRDCWNRPITGVPGRIIRILERRFYNDNEKYVLTNNAVDAINIGSYNYLGLATNEGKIIEEVINTLNKYPVNLPGTSRDVERVDIVRQLESEVADFLHKEDCLISPMGFFTNSGIIPAIMDEGCLILSDEYNHTSIVYGARMANAYVRTFVHNNIKDLELKLINYITQGQPITHRSWRKIFVLVEGIYSMEGTILKLEEIIELKKKYKFYLFIDEAHSIGAMGKTGRGICEFLNVNFDNVDILMGTFTKSFGGFGGYITGSKDLISYLRCYSDASLYGEQMPPAVATQILESLKILKYTEEGKKLTTKLLENTLYFRKRLTELGYIIFGDVCSPVVPLMIFNPSKISMLSRMCLERKIAVVVVGYPATPVLSSRVRFCLSAAHTKDDLDLIINVMDYVGQELGLNIKKRS